MFAPRPELVVAEFARVLKPGGLLAMANWTPNSFAGQMFKVTGRHAPAPMGITPPVHWGHAKIVRDRLASSFHSVDLETVRIDFDFPGNAAEAVAFFRTYFGPTQSAFNALDEPGQAALAADLEALWTSGNVAEDPATHTLVPNQYLQVIARSR
jgi:SAM-dependent methyltransferase